MATGGNNIQMTETIWLLKVWDRWGGEYDIVGYLGTKDEADTWLSKAVQSGNRRIEEVKKFVVNNG